MKENPAIVCFIVVIFLRTLQHKLSKIVLLTFPGEIICGLGKTGEESGNEAENYSFISTSNKRENIPTNFQSCIV